MTTKLEQVARALAAHSLDINGNDAPVDYSAIIDRIWPRFVGQARAAIEAMKGPPPEMVEAGRERHQIGEGQQVAMLSASLPTTTST